MSEANVATRSIVCQQGYNKRKLVRALMGGTEEMVRQGTNFTPQYPGEVDESYQSRLAATKLYNGYSDAIKKSTGKVLSKDIVTNDDVPSQIKDLATNIDGQGRNLTAFILDVFRESMIDGISFIYVDFPKVSSSVEGEKPFLSDQMAQGARPNAILYLADQILGFEHENNNGTEELTQIRISEVVTEKVGEWGQKAIDQVRVLGKGTYQLWRFDDSATVEQWYLYDEGTTSSIQIPITPVYTNRTGYMTGEPPLQALAELNLEHWISSTDQRKALTFARFAMMVFSGVEPNSITLVGPDQIICIREPDAKWGKVESSGEGVIAGRLDIEAIEKRMQTAGMTIQVQGASGDVTATAASIDSDEANAALMAAAGALEDSVDQMFQLFAMYMSLGNGGTCSVNKQFGRRRSSLTVTDYVQLFNSGLLDGDTILSELQKRGDISDDVDLKAVAQNIIDNPPNLLGQDIAPQDQSNFSGNNDNNSL